MAAPAGAPPRGRDRVAKLLALLDFSASRGAEGLDQTLSVLLFSLMGEFAATGGAVLVAGPHGELVARVARGRGARELAGRRLEAEPGPPPACVRLSDLEPGSPLHALAADMPVEIVAPVQHRGRAVGCLLLARRASGLPYREDDLELVRVVASIAGTVVASHLLYDELTDANRSLRRNLFDLHTIFDVSRELNASVEPEAVYRVLAQTAMAHVLVTQCLILLAEPGRLRKVFSRGVSLAPADEEAIGRLDGGPGAAFDDLVERLRRAGIVRLVPLKAGPGTRGFLGIGARKDGRPLSDEDERFLATLGNQAVTALDNLKLHQDRVVRERLERELAIARDIQTGLLPKALPRLAGWDLAAASEPCFEVGGDYFDALLAPSGLLLAAGDVSGKSIPAALLMSVLQATIRALGRRPGETPATLLEALNRTLVESTQPGKFASFFLAVLEAGGARLRYTNGGHNPPLVVRRDGTVERLTVGGPVLGIFEDARFEMGETRLEPGELLFVYTDGVTEAVDHSDEEFGEARLIRVLLDNQALPAAELLGAVLGAVHHHARGLHPADDITALLLRREAAPGEAA